MGRLMFLVTLLFALPAAAEDVLPICRQPRVMDAVRERLSRAGQPVTLEEASAGQLQGERSGVVSCAVRTHRIVYDTRRLGEVPADVVEVYQYSLELRKNGIFLMP